MIDPTPSDIFLSALTSRDFARLAQSLAPSARARFLLPRGAEERSGRDEIARRLEGWFAPASEFEVLAAFDEPLGSRRRLGWRFRLRRESGPREIIEQVAFVDAERDGIVSIDLMCSGFLLEQTPTAQSADLHLLAAPRRS